MASTEKIIILEKFDLVIRFAPVFISPDSSILVIIPSPKTIEDFKNLNQLPAFYKRTKWNNGNGLQFSVNDSYLDLKENQQKGIADTLRMEERDSLYEVEIAYKGSNGQRSKEIRDLLYSFV